MKKSIIRLVVLLLVMTFISFLACMSVKVTAKDAEDHVGNFPPGQAYAIDGLYKDAWNNQYRIEKQRIYKVGGFYPQIHIHKMEKKEIGRYEGLLYFAPSRLLYQISPISESQVLLRSEANDLVLHAITLDFPDDFSRELAHLERIARQPRIEALGAKCRPNRIRPGDAFRFIIDYCVYEDPDQPDAPLEFIYSIEKDGQRLFASRPAELPVSSGETKQRRVDLKAARDEGEYRIISHLTCGALSAKDTSMFVIDAAAPPPDKRPLKQRLVGVYESKSPGYGTSYLHITLENGTLMARVVDPTEAAKVMTYTVHFVEIRGDALWMRMSMTLNNLDMYGILEWEIALNDELDDMPVRTIAVEGNMVPVGQVYNSTLYRVR